MADLVNNGWTWSYSDTVRLHSSRVLFVMLVLICFVTIGCTRDLNRDMASELMKAQLEKDPYMKSFSLGRMNDGKYLKRQIPSFPSQCDIREMMALASNGFITINLEKTLPARGYGPEEYYSIEITPLGQQYQFGEIETRKNEKTMNFRILTLENIAVTGITSEGSDKSAKVVEFTAKFKKTPIANIFNAYSARKLEKQIKAKFKKYDDGWRLTDWDSY